MSKICIVTFAADYYRSYIPLFLFCLFRTYTEYEAVIFLRKPLGVMEKPGLKLIDGKFKFVIVDGFPKLKPRIERVKLFQTARFLVLTPSIVELLSDYDYIYLTDVDILFMPEKVPLHEQHIKHMEVLGLPYSNFIRNTEPPRLTGLHFGSLGFYRQVAPIVEKYANLVKINGIPDGYGPCPDEAIWHRIVQESGMGLPPKCSLSEQETWGKVFDPDNYLSKWFGPHHGVHVGFGRAMKRFRPIFDLPFYRQYMHSFGKLIADERFRILYNGLHPQAKAALKAVIEVGK